MVATYSKLNRLQGGLAVPRGISPAFREGTIVVDYCTRGVDAAAAAAAAAVGVDDTTGMLPSRTFAAQLLSVAETQSKSVTSTKRTTQPHVCKAICVHVVYLRVHVGEDCYMSARTRGKITIEQAYIHDGKKSI